MNRILILFLMSFALVKMVAAIDEPRVIRQSELLVKRINQVHVSPRTVDDSFGKSVNELLLKSIDPYHFVFSAEDQAEFQQLSVKIDDDITGKQLTYFKSVSERFETRSVKFMEWCTDFLKKPSVFTKTFITDAKLDKAVMLSGQNQRWKEIVLLEVIERILSYLPENSTTFPVDSLTNWEVKARKATADYYSNLFAVFKDDSQVIEDAYLSAIALSFDPHTNYFSPTDKKQFEQELSSEREMYGFSFGESPDGKIIITNVVPGSPAWISDQVHEGDKITRVGLKGKPVFMVEDQQHAYSRLREYLNDTESKQITLYLTNEKGEEVRVELIKAKIYSDGDVIKNAVLKGKNTIGYISLPDFYVNWGDPNGLGCANDVAKCLLKLMKENIGGLILDLRGNGGGSLREAVDISGLFIDYGPILAVRNKGDEIEVLRDINRGSIYNGPLIIMVDAGSASASEIVAGVLQDYRKAVIVGEQTFGKATSQSIYSLNPLGDSELAAYLTAETSTDGYANITNGELYRVTGDWNQEKGVTPDVVLPFRFDRNLAERESDYPNVLIPDTLSKKMTFIPAAMLPLDQLRTSSETRIKNNETFRKYKALIVEMEQLYVKDTLVYFSPQEQWSILHKWEQLRTDLDTLEKQIDPGYKAASNQFDEVVYHSADWLWEYHRRFLEELNRDVELIETVNILNELIEQKK